MAEPLGFWVSQRSRKGAITAVRMDPNDILTTSVCFCPVADGVELMKAASAVILIEPMTPGVNVEAAAYGIGSWVPQGMGRSALGGAAT